ncbi:apoptosis facilitator Bcl-2-like protein 14 isoform X2 [Chanodichthys erythropterus]|uniref:apoptosis facilitator Bcl-2-like protein 14 isoform X2 n=1 Tax=Chanodichthys erythropterus TaxID=933992 RepID=UPI00351EBC9A
MAQDSNGDVQIPSADSPEFRLLKAYARKRRPMDTRLKRDIPERETSTAEPIEEHSKAKKRRKGFSFFLRCIKPKTDDTPEPQPAMLEGSDDVKVDEMENMVSELTEISDSVHFTPCELETDDLPADVVERLAELLRAHGDELDEKIKADKALNEALQSSFKYDFFKKVMDVFCRSVSLELPTEQKGQKVDIALICEATNQLYGVNYHPMNRVLGFGAKYLQDTGYSKWISRNIQCNGEVGDESIEEVQ